MKKFKLNFEPLVELHAIFFEFNCLITLKTLILYQRIKYNEINVQTILLFLNELKEEEYSTYF